MHHRPGHGLCHHVAIHPRRVCEPSDDQHASRTASSAPNGTSSGTTSSAISSTTSSAPGSASSVPDAVWQDLANQATRALNVSAVYVDARPMTNKAVYRCREMRIELGTNRNAVSARATLAHELGHHVLRHCGERPVQEMEATALAITIMEDVWGDTPAQGRDFMARLLYANRSNTWNSVHDTCAELRDLLRRYPTTTDPRQTGQCGG